MVLFDAHSFNTFDDWSRRIFLDNELPCSLQIRGFGFMEEVDMKPANDLNEEAIDVLQRFVVGLQCLNQLWGRVEEFLWKCNGTDLLEQ